MSDTFLAQQDILLHAYDSDLFLQLDKRLGEVGTTKQIKASSKIFLLTVPRLCIFCGSFLIFMSCVSHTFLPFIGAL